MKYVLVLISMMMFLPSTSFANACEKTKMARVTQLGKLFSSSKFKKLISRKGYDFSTVLFEEADDGCTEPVYTLILDHTVGNSFRNLCYLVEFDTDEPNKNPSIKPTGC